MKSRTLMLFGVSALILGGTMVGCSKTGGSAHVASAGATGVAPDAGKAVKEAEKARQAMAKHKGDDAVGYAENAVAFSPHDANYRALLGQAYLSAGRFQSAAQAFSDTLELDKSNGRAALNLALAQTALGDWTTARKTLTQYSDQIAPADRGLALALAGDPNGAIQLLSIAARDPSAGATVRQNFALALALGGHWREARAVAAVDLPPAQVDQRIGEWAQFARPKAASDQVATLLGVTAAKDQGQPVQLALTAPAPVVPAATAVLGADTTSAVPAESDTKVADSSSDTAPSDLGATLASSAHDVAGGVDDRVTGGDTTLATSAVPASSASGVRFASAKPMVQPLPKKTVTAKPAPTPAPVKAASAKPAPVADTAFKPTGGNYYVQLGAYDNAAVARDAWRRIHGRTPKLAELTPRGMPVTVKGKAYYRLSVGGFARNNAAKVCADIKAHGGRCFVRADAGDKLAKWVKRDTQLASR